ncbi:hypothetical protein [Novosphingobium huizhouense]|uniref:hypothetical protein n=1 Tax=Novosphingobium huizhouense TaxID=2866625 RepID=UPI001CD8D31A|nr:hypothetical protein [Novosphingobium huizhouense]
MDTPETTTLESAFAPLLNLDTLIIRPVIAIDDQRYEILSPDELSIIDGHRFGVWGRRINAIAESDVASEAEEAELEELVDRIAKRVAVGVPAEVFARLSGAAKQAIVDVFTGLLLGKRLGLAGAIAKAVGTNGAIGDQLTGESSSPGSSGSTAAVPNGGWLKRLARWFALS